MSLSGAVNSAVSALTSQSTTLAIVADNLANASTVGYKTNYASFESLLSDSDAAAYASGGVTVAARSSLTEQGLLTASSTATNVAIEGSGFFAVSAGETGNDIYYTRNGEFTLDDEGYLVNNGYYLLGWETDADGNILGSTTVSTLEAIDTDALTSAAAATTMASLTATLPANAAVGDTYTSSMEVYDSLGTAANVTITWEKTAENEWTATFSDPTAAGDSATTIGTVTSAPITITFNGDGTLASTSPAAPSLTIDTWTTGAADSSISLDLGTAGTATGLGQYTTDAETVGLEVDQNGNAYGSLSGITIDDEGTVLASFTNGEQKAIYKIALATFTNADGLSAVSGGLYQATKASGTSVFHVAGEGGAGTISGGMLEASTTDTTAEFSSMMSAQQAYSAAAQVMSTVNSMYETLMSAVR